MTTQPNKVTLASELDHISLDLLPPYRMGDHRVPSQQANPISANPYPHPALHRLQGQVRRLGRLTRRRRRLTMCIVR